MVFIKRLIILSQLWKDWIPSAQISTFQQMGSYSDSPIRGLRIISLNSVIYSEKNKSL